MLSGKWLWTVWRNLVPLSSGSGRPRLCSLTSQKSWIFSTAVTTLGLHDRDCHALFTLGSSSILHFLCSGHDYTFLDHCDCYVMFYTACCKISFKLFRRPNSNVKYLLIYSEDPVATMFAVSGYKGHYNSFIESKNFWNLQDWYTSHFSCVPIE
jgi:hypothetical protein